MKMTLTLDKLGNYQFLALLINIFTFGADRAVVIHGCGNGLLIILSFTTCCAFTRIHRSSLIHTSFSVIRFDWFLWCFLVHKGVQSLPQFSIEN